MPKQIFPKFAFLFFGIFGFCLLTGFYVFAVWKEPSETPPSGNAEVPLNISSIDQFKTGRIGIYASGIDTNYGLTVGDSGIKATGDSYFEGNLTLARLESGPATRTLTLVGKRADDVSVVGEIVFQNNDNGTEYPSAAIVNKNYCGDRDGALYFYTARQGSLPSVPHLTVHCNGMIGIGTVSPQEKLHVTGGNALFDRGSQTTDVTRELALGGVASAQGNRFASLLFRNYDSGSDFIAADISGYQDGAGRAGLLFRVSQNRTRFNVMTIDSDGNVGIGTSNPGVELEINGGVRLLTSNSRPQCNSSTRGTLWFVQGGSGVADALQACSKNADDTYGWKNLF